MSYFSFLAAPCSAAEAASPDTAIIHHFPHTFITVIILDAFSNQPFQTDFTSVLSLTPPTFHNLQDVWTQEDVSGSVLPALIASLARRCWPVWCFDALVDFQRSPVVMKTWKIKLRWERFHCDNQCGVTQVFLKLFFSICADHDTSTKVKHKKADKSRQKGYVHSPLLKALQSCRISDRRQVIEFCFDAWILIIILKKVSISSNCLWIELCSLSGVNNSCLDNFSFHGVRV